MLQLRASIMSSGYARDDQHSLPAPPPAGRTARRCVTEPKNAVARLPHFPPLRYILSELSVWVNSNRHSGSLLNRRAHQHTRAEMTNTLTPREVSLPALNQSTNPLLDSLTNAIGIDREVLASETQIGTAWQNLPQLLTEIPPEKRDEGIMRMCVAVASGLFDAAVNYAWNAVIVELRRKIRMFGINIIPQIIDGDFDESKLLDLQDSDLLSLCLKLNLISETGYFMLSQCRDIRNNFSVAHPAVGTLDEFEFLNFLSRCSRHALCDESNTEAVDIKALMQALNSAGFSDEQYQIWNDRIGRTFDAQREAIFGMLHGLYCDPAKEEHARVNAITICRFTEAFSPEIISTLVNQHQRYQASGDQARYRASQAFFQNIGKLGLLSEMERHAIISAACKNLINVHGAMNNFYNEPPFADRLASLAMGHQIPETVRSEFVTTVVTCSVGNQYGTSRAADICYRNMIAGMSPMEIGILLSLPNTDTLVASRLKDAERCKRKYGQIVRLLDASSIPTRSHTVYEHWIQD